MSKHFYFVAMWFNHAIVTIKHVLVVLRYANVPGWGEREEKRETVQKPRPSSSVFKSSLGT